jgi:hypothetical protein
MTDARQIRRGFSPLFRLFEINSELCTTDRGQPSPNLRDSAIPRVLLRENVAALDRAVFARNSLHRKLNRCPVA